MVKRQKQQTSAAGGRTRSRRGLLLPGQHHRKAIVAAPVRDEEGGVLRGHVNYIVELDRLDSAWKADIQWVDHQRQGHQVVLPHQVMLALFRQRDSIMAACRKDRAQLAARTRKQKQIALSQAEEVAAHAEDNL